MKTRLEQQYPWLDDRSNWREVIERDVPRIDPAGTGHGGWTLGNGHVFAVRHGDQVSRLSHLLGPTYQRDAHFPDWGTQHLEFLRDGQPIPWDYQEAFRVRRTAIIGAEMRTEDLRCLIVDVAPPDWPLILRTISLQNAGAQTITNLQLDVLHDNLPPGECYERPDGWEIIQPERRLRVVLQEKNPPVDGSHILLNLPKLAPGDEETIRIALITGRDEAEIDLLMTKLALNTDGVPSATYHRWQGWMRDILTVSGSDATLGDLIDDATVTIATQQGPAGAIPPLAARSIAAVVEEAPALHWLLHVGKVDAVRAALAARYDETCRRGSFAYWLPADSTLAAPPVHEPEWAQLTPPPAWTAAAIVRAHWEYWRQSGDDALLRRHFYYLRWLLELQPISPEGLVPFGGDEPFLTTFQRKLTLEQQEHLLPDSSPYAFMREYPWGAAPAMALCAAADLLAAMSYDVDEVETGQRLGELAARLREATERAYWLDDEEYYAAAISRVDERRYRLPHLPTALAPFTTGYANSSDPHARRGVDTALQFLIDETGLPLTTPEVRSFSGSLPGELLSVMAATDDLRRDKIDQALLSCASPAGEFRTLYGSVEKPAPANGLAHPAEIAVNMLGVLDYLIGSDQRDDMLALTPHLPPTFSHLHIENLHLAGQTLEVVTTRKEDRRVVQVGNAGPHPLRMRLQEDIVDETAAYLLAPGERRQWTLSLPMAQEDMLPTPQEYSPPALRLPRAPVLVLTVDGESFADWRSEYDAVILDAAMPISPRDFAAMLQQDTRRRYDVLYLDVPKAGAIWSGLSESFWNDQTLRQAMERFRDLGGIISGTLFVDSWQVEIAGRAPFEIASHHAWVTLPHVEGTVTATSMVPWESADDEVVELLLYAADGTAMELSVNGERLWRRGETPERQRVRIDALLHPGENQFALRAGRRPGRGFGFCLGIRAQLRWNKR